MVAPCEIAVKCVVPVVRSLMAKGLQEKFGFTQETIGSFLGVTQAAVSYYFSKTRGNAFNLGEDEEIRALVEKVIDNLNSNAISAELLISETCDICRTIRTKRKVCSMHKRMDPRFDITYCEICLKT